MVTKITKDEVEEASPLDGLLEAADANVPPEPTPPPPPRDNLEEDIFDTLKMAQAAVGPLMWWLSPDQFQALWGDKTLKAMAAPCAEIMRRHGWNLGEVLGKYAPYIALVLAVAQPVAITVKLYKQATRPHEPTPAPPPEGGGDGVTGD